MHRSLGEEIGVEGGDSIMSRAVDEALVFEYSNLKNRNSKLSLDIKEIMNGLRVETQKHEQESVKIVRMGNVRT